MLEAIRQPLLAEALKSPALLSDLAGLEQIVAESYDARSFVELLQNADDAGASRFAIHRSGDFLLVANDGHHFTRRQTFRVFAGVRRHQSIAARALAIEALDSNRWSGSRRSCIC